MRKFEITQRDIIKYVVFVKDDEILWYYHLWSLFSRDIIFKTEDKSYD